MITNIAKRLLIAFLFGVPSAYACSCYVLSLDKRFGDSDEVFLARVEAVRIVETSTTATTALLPSTTKKTYEATLRIVKMFKGQDIETMKITYSRIENSVSCALDVRVDLELLILRKRGQTVDVDGGATCLGYVIARPTLELMGELEELVQ